MGKKFYKKIQFLDEYNNFEKEQEINLQLTLERQATWQFLVDHATPHERGYVIRFIVRNEQDFWRRVAYRNSGYVRNNTREMQLSVDRIIFGAKRRGAFNKTLDELSRDGPLYVKMLLMVRGWLNAYIGRLVQQKMKHWKLVFDENEKKASE